MIHPKEAKELLYRMFEDHYVSLTVCSSRVWCFHYSTSVPFVSYAMEL